jgi:2,4-dienoyl-CoA reductase-like NADH-dependent reductase (Old Yellow Enzyme family)
MTSPAPIVQVRRLDTAEAFLGHLRELGADLPFDATVDPAGPLSTPIAAGAAGEDIGELANRFAVLPMEGWDATEDGRPTDLVRRRWRRFGESGAGLVWGGEAVAVRADGRANPHQLVIGDHVAELRGELLDAHRARFGATAAEPVIGLQLTHSGRYAHAEPLVAYSHPVLDERRRGRVLTDGELDDLVGDVVAAAATAARAGFAFVDVKACHGYLGHELLSAVDRPGPYGGDLADRSRFLRAAVDGVRAEVPRLGVAVRLSAFDVVPFVAGDDGTGRPEVEGPYRYAFGGDGTGLGIDLSEPITVVADLAARGVRLVCVTAGSPYTCPHAQRPAYFPPSDGYRPPEDPLHGVARLVAAAAGIKAAVPDAVVVGSGYSYLQEWLPHVAQAVVRTGGADVIGVGRMVLSYPDLPADVLAGRPLDRRRLCRTFSDCTTAPRQGLVSGCFPLDDFYKARPERRVLVAAKRASRTGPPDG